MPTIKQLHKIWRTEMQLFNGDPKDEQSVQGTHGITPDEGEFKNLSSNLPVISSKFLRAGTILIPKPEWIEYYKQAGMFEYVVTEQDEKNNGTIGNNWMIKQ